MDGEIYSSSTSEANFIQKIQYKYITLDTEFLCFDGL